MRAIGLDVGDRTIGVAVSDLLGVTAQGITTIERIGIKKDCDKVISYIQEYECDTVIIGLPLRLDGTDSPQTEKVREFRTKLENKMRAQRLHHVAVDYYDERLTTVMAHQSLIEGGMRREKRAEIVDEVAAVFILQNYLDYLSLKREREGS